MRFIINIIMLVMFLITVVTAQELALNGNYIRHPQSLTDGTVYTDNNYSALYFYSADTSREILRGRNVGQYFTIAPDRKTLGVKLIEADGRQTPAVIDVRTRELTRLRASAEQIGQVSFTSDGRIAYTVGNDLIISDGRMVKLGNYANIAPISPDGAFVCFNDASDQLWLMNIDYQIKIRITDAEMGYYQPKWSPDGRKILFSAFNGDVKIYELTTQQTYTITSGDNPDWNVDSETIIFTRKKIEDFKLIDSDIYTAKYNGELITNITNTPDVIEMDASFDDTGEKILYQTYRQKTIKRIRLGKSKNSLDDSESVIIAPEKIETEYFSPVAKVAKSAVLNVPYLHQVYDVPNWFWGYYACAPTTAAMLLAYYNILPVWNVTCSNPSSHTSKWGRYICEQYMYRETNYISESSPNGHTAGKGGYGYMWETDGSPNSRMANYYQLHGLTTSQIWPGNTSTTWTIATNEISNGYPYSMCVWLTSSGHLVLAKGVVEGKHSLVFNDPYGNRNGSIYPAYNGAGVIYDWPGYNEGNANLAYTGTGIPWCISAHYTVTAISDTLTDDLNLANGFTLNTAPPASMAYWKDKKTGGYNNHFWYTDSRTTSTCSAQWTAPLTRVGKYEVLAYIPTLTGLTANATYHIRTGAGDSNIVVDQNAHQGSWVSLGIHYFDVEKDDAVYLSDRTGQTGNYVAFDAIKWRFIEEPSLTLSFNSYTGDWYREGPPKTIFFQGKSSYYPEYAHCRWDFGDGSTADSLNPEHIFRTAGNFKVTFAVIYDNEEISTDTTITIQPAAAADFALLIPENETVLTTVNPLFYWIPKSLKSQAEISDRSQMLVGYRNFKFYLNRNSSFHTIEPVELDTNLYRPTEPLTENAEYFWTVITEDTAGIKTHSAIWSFIINTENSAPAAFSLISPSTGEVITNLRPTFEWETTDDVDPNDTITYRLKIGTGLGEMQTIYEGNETTCTVTDLLTDNTIYYWQVLAIDASGVITPNDGEFSTFYTNMANDPPSAVRLLTPQDGSLISTQSPLFLWTAGKDPDPEETLKYYLIYWRNDFNYNYQYQTDTTYCDRRKVLSNRTYWWYVKVMDAAGDSAISDTFSFTTSNVGIEDENSFPAQFVLHQNYPNPFNPSTTISFDLPEEVGISLVIYDLIGREIVKLLNGNQPAGKMSVLWNGKDQSGQAVASGIYLYILKTTTGRHALKKMVLIR